MQVAVIKFINYFCELTEDGVLTAAEWTKLKESAAQDNLNLNEALHYARPYVLALIREAVEVAGKDEVITTDEERHIHYLLNMLSVPDSFAQDVRETLKEWKLIEKVRGGHLPVASSNLYMLPDEICHLETDAIYINTETKTFPRRQGTLTVTNKKFIFISAQTAFDVEWKKVSGVVKESEMLYVDTTGRRGTGFYQTARLALTEAIMAELLRSFRESERDKSEKAKERARQRERASPPPRGPKKSAHEILNVPVGAGRDEITLAYRRMAKLYHPDKVATLAPEFKELAEHRMKEINAAYQQLTK